MSTPSQHAVNAAKKLFPTGLKTENLGFAAIIQEHAIDPAEDALRDLHADDLARWNKTLAEKDAAIRELVEALEDIISKEWQVSCDWCPYEDRQALLDNSRAIAAKHKGA